MSDEHREQRLRAAALRYNQEKDSAPKLVAQGAGLIAERILEIAKENDVYIHEDPDLVALLAKLDVGSDIPEDLYRAVAEVLAFVYRLNGEFAAKEQG